MSKSKYVKGITVIAVLSVILASLLAGCSGKKSDVQETPSQSVAPTSSTQESSTPPAEPPVELTILAPQSGVSYPPGVQDDPVAKEITKQTGVIMNITTSNAAGDVNAKIAAMITGGDLPDITFFPTPELMQSAVAAKAVLPLDDYLEKYGQDLVKNVPFMLQVSKASLSIDDKSHADGKLYFLPNFVGAGTDPLLPGLGLTIRWDLYKKLGYPKIDKVENLIPILQQMMKLEPTNADGKKNYGVAANLADGQWSGDSIIWEKLSGLYGYAYGNYSSVMNITDNKYVPILTDVNSNYFRSVKWLNEAYKAKILDPDSFTMKYDNYTEKIHSGRVFMGFSPGEFRVTNQAYLKQGLKDKYFVSLPPPNDSTAIVNGYNIQQGNPTVGYGVSVKCKHPEKAMEFLNFLASYDGQELLINGVKGQTCDVVNGKPALKPEVVANMTNPDPNFPLTSGAGKYGSLILQVPNAIDPQYNTPLNFGFQPEFAALRLQPADKEADKYFGVEIPLELITKNKNIAKTIQDAPEAALMPPLPRDLQDQANKIDSYVLNNYIKMVLANSDEQFTAQQTKFIGGLKSLGYEKIVQWYNDQRQIALTKLKK